MAKSKSYGGLIALLVLLGAAGGGTWYYLKSQGEKKPEFLTTKVTRGDITQAVTATGDLQPVVVVDVGAQVSGQIKEVLVDFNSRVKAGDVLARIDESTPTQRLKQAEADLESAKASNKLVQLNVERTRELHKKNLVSQQELDSAEAQLAQSNATLLTRIATVNNAKLDLERTVITAPIDGMVLNRNTDKGRTVNASTNAPTLFTLVNDLTKMQINAAVAEADIGLIQEGQLVRFTVDAYPNRPPFTGTVRQVRNAATANQSVVSYATIIDVTNENLLLKPGMTANVSIIVAEKRDVLRIANQALRARIPSELQSKIVASAAPAPKAGESVAAKTEAPAKAADSMTDDERRTAMRTIMTEAGIQRGTPPTPEQIEKVKKMAEEKGIDPEQVTRMASMMSGVRGPGGGGRRGGGGGGGGQGGSGGGGGFTTTITSRPVFKLVNPDAEEKKIESVTARLGVSDGIYTEVLGGLAEGDTVITAVTMPGAAPVMQPQQGGVQNPFQQGGRGGFRGR